MKLYSKYEKCDWQREIEPGLTYETKPGLMDEMKIGLTYETCSGFQSETESRSRQTTKSCFVYEVEPGLR